VEATSRTFNVLVQNLVLGLDGLSNIASNWAYLCTKLWLLLLTRWL